MFQRNFQALSREFIKKFKAHLLLTCTSARIRWFITRSQTKESRRRRRRRRRRGISVREIIKRALPKVVRRWQNKARAKWGNFKRLSRRNCLIIGAQKAKLLFCSLLKSTGSTREMKKRKNKYRRQPQECTRITSDAAAASAAAACQDHNEIFEVCCCVTGLVRFPFFLFLFWGGFR